MKSFHFTLEAVRTLRQRQEQIAMERYAEALAFRQQALDRLEKVKEELNAGLQDLRIRLTKGCAATEAAQAGEYHKSLAKCRDEFTLALGNAERRVNAALQNMLGARQQRELVDKYFANQKSRHQRDQARTEQKIMDDLARRRGNSILAWNPTEMPT